MASEIDSYIFYTVIGILIGTSFVVFFSLFVAMCILKKRSKVSLHHPAMEPSSYEMVGVGQKVSEIEVETNSAYGIAAK